MWVFVGPRNLGSEAAILERIPRNLGPIIEEQSPVYIPG